MRRPRRFALGQDDGTSQVGPGQGQFPGDGQGTLPGGGGGSSDPGDANGNQPTT